MTYSPDVIAELRAKELELLQAIIARMDNHSATLKNFCITLSTAVAGFALTVQRPLAIALAMLPVGICALLDAQYLRNERRFRDLFHLVRQEPPSDPPDFNINLAAAPPRSYFSAFCGWSVLGFYGPLAAAVGAVTLIMGSA